MRCLWLIRKEREKRGQGRRKEKRKENRDGNAKREKKKIGNEINKKD